ncbi:hypothetical protein Slala03_47390 [Streptomyces lavendulae subsp. lavendulae]|uniref:hypothetical protein n=1 Tax=Streptomyces lavendulae TaxID=1914 RepID=UPI0024A105CD|nr:hypothetical protein [Streptomyces lavendulae]GLV85050.1 hypothetical protein Slala03_47390 [Streptomyces lavendulae subsp. lavendulae]
MREPVNRTILLLDIERFSRRDDVVQAVLRRTLNGIVDRTLEAAGVEATQQYREDRGDGLIVLLSGDVAKTVLLRSLLTTTPELLHEHNLIASDSAQMRLRIVLAVGEVAHDPHAGTTGGLVGHDLNQACRLLDADVLRSALAARGDEHCVLAVSAPVYEGVVRHGHRGVRPELFRPTDATVKDGVLSAWIHQGAAPDRTPAPATAAAAPATVPAPVPATAAPAPRPAGDPAPDPAATGAPAPAGGPSERSAGAVFHFHGAPVIHGSLVGGDQTGVSGGEVRGDVVLGGTRTGHGPTDGSRS